MSKALALDNAKSSTRKILLLCVFAAATDVEPSNAATYRSLYRFAGGANGKAPYSGVIIGVNGVLYGTTSYGGSVGAGTVYSLRPPVPPETRWTKTTLHHFNGTNGGAYPAYGKLISDSTGALYGLTMAGGSYGNGTIYKLAPPVPPSTRWIRSVLYSFKGGADGRTPEGALTFGPDGSLYGTTRDGGGVPGGCGGECGVVFKLSPPVPPSTRWTESVIHRFREVAGDGYQPAAVQLQFDANGALYGTTPHGGANGQGIVFKLTPPTPPASVWTETIIHNFQDTLLSLGPWSGVTLDSSGVIYGTSLNGTGFGSVYKLSPPTPPATQWTYTVLRNHVATSEGGPEYSPIAIGPDGALYGATSGGARFGFGSVYKLTPPSPPSIRWSLSGAYFFRGANYGYGPAWGGLTIDANGVLYGTTYGGGGPADAGTIFQIQ